MELWIPDVVDVKQVEEIINKWLEKDKLSKTVSASDTAKDTFYMAAASFASNIVHRMCK